MGEKAPLRVGSAEGDREPQEARDSFEEARTVFLDEEALLRPDEDHSDDEDRFLLL